MVFQSMEPTIGPVLPCMPGPCVTPGDREKTGKPVTDLSFHEICSFIGWSVGSARHFTGIFSVLFKEKPRDPEVQPRILALCSSILPFPSAASAPVCFSDALTHVPNNGVLFQNYSPGEAHIYQLPHLSQPPQFHSFWAVGDPCVCPNLGQCLYRVLCSRFHSDLCSGGKHALMLSSKEKPSHCREDSLTTRLWCLQPLGQDEVYEII